MIRNILLVILIIVAMALLGCSPKPPATVSISEVSYGSGVYVVPFNDNVANMVAAFIAKHPELRITAMYAAREGAYGVTTDLLLVTEAKK